MWVKSINLNNVRSFLDAKLSFSKGINLLVGPNNAGKSTILLPLLGIQKNLPNPQAADVRLGKKAAKIIIGFEDIDGKYFPENIEQLYYEYRPQHNDFPLMGTPKNPSSIQGNQPQGVKYISASEPDNFIYPFVSKRKVTKLGEQVSDSTVKAVESTFSNLNSKIDRLSNPEFQPAHDLYMRACDDILGFRITTDHTSHGKRAVYTVHNMDNIPLLAMGEGTMNILGLAVHLAMAENKLFVIEEPENDVHPKALKALLDIIREKATNNQFILTTHSSIVLKCLGAHPDAKVFKLDFTFEKRMPTASVKEISDSSEERQDLLIELGYELSDSDLWEGWLILEESSAEKIIREYLIPWFVPKLQNRLRTYSARTISEVAPKFKEFNDLFVFLHLEPTYKGKAWVLIDSGEKEQRIIEDLKNVYAASGWDPSHFMQLNHHDFEDYYPAQFSDQVDNLKTLRNKQERRTAKNALLADVEKAISENRKTMREAFKDSAQEVIDKLIDIEQHL